MEEWQQENLESCLVEICHQLNIHDTIKKLRVQNIFDIHDQQIILNDSLHRNDKEKRQKIVDTLMTRQKKSYWIFCHIIKDKLPQVFNKLHSGQNIDCTSCNEEHESEGNISNFYKGILEISSDPDTNSYVEDPEESIDLFQNKQLEIRALKNDVRLLEEEVEKLRKQNGVLIDQHLQDAKRLTIKEQELERKEREVKEMLSEKDAIKITLENSTIGHKNKENGFKEYIEKLEKENDEYVKRLKKIENDLRYVNHEYIGKSIMDQLETKNMEYVTKCKLLNEELTSCKQECARLRIRKETLDNLLEQQNKEMSRKINDLRDKYEHAQNQINIYENEIENSREQARVSKQEREETMRDRDHWLNKFYKKDNMLRELQVKLSTLEKEQIAATMSNHNLEENLKKVSSIKEELMTQYKSALSERDEVKKHFRCLLEKYDEIVLKNIDESKQNKNHNAKRELVIQNLLDEIEEQNLKLNRLCETKPAEKEIVLVKYGETFGIEFGLKQEPVYIGQSRIIISKVHYKGSAPLTEIKEGLYVIKINDVNVQEFDLIKVHTLCEKTKDHMKLVLRKPERSNRNHIQFAHFNCTEFNEIGIKFSLTAKVIPGSEADKLGLSYIDDLIVDSKYETECLSIENIKNRIMRCVKDKQGKIIFKCGTNEATIKTRLLLEEDIQQQIPRENSDYSSMENHIRPAIRHVKETDVQQTNGWEPYVHQTDAFKLHVQEIDIPKMHMRKSDAKMMEKQKTNTSKTNVKQIDAQPIYENEMVDIKLRKKEYEGYGFLTIGGNKTGIFIKSVDNWTPADQFGIKVGWRILKVNCLSLDSVAFCYAQEVLQKFSKHTEISFVFDPLPFDTFEDIIKTKPHYDSFYVKALIDYQSLAVDELSFCAGDVLQVINSYVLTDPYKPYRWKAVKEELDNSYVSGYIPRQISCLLQRTKQEHEYEEIDQECVVGSVGKNKPTLRVHGTYYKLLDPVGEVLV